MSYNISLTNGASLVNVPDGTLNNTTTNLNLVGRNFAGFGGFLNENFIYLLENASNPTAPVNPLIGQLWWDSTGRHLNVWQGTGWKVISSSMTGPTAPTFPVVGDYWWNTTTSLFSVYNGTQWISIGPYIVPGSVLSTLLGNTVSYTTNNGSTTTTVGNVVVNNKLTGVFSSESGPINTVNSAFAVLNPGLNLFGGVTAQGNLITSSNVVASTVSATTANFSNVDVSSGLTVSELSVNGAATFNQPVVFTQPVTLPTVTNQSFTSNVVPSANLSYNLGSPTLWWNNIYGTSIHAQYADLAERFETDESYEPGTVVELGGEAEITAVVEDLSDSVFGVISTKAAFVMNGSAGDDTTHPPVAVQGRVPVKVIGKIRKGDRLVSAGNGIARSGTKSEITTWNVIGRSLQNKDTDEIGTVEAVVKINS